MKPVFVSPILRNALIAASAMAMAGCAPIHTMFGSDVGQGTPASTQVGAVDSNGMNVRAQVKYRLATGDQSVSLMNMLISVADAATVLEPIQTVLAPATSFQVDTSQFVVPSAPNAFVVNDFGFLKISDLKDNNLDVCGRNGDSHCGTAFIRVYTEGTDGAGLWNAKDQYGAPITAGQTQDSLASVGLDTSGALVVQQAALSADKHVALLSDFPNAKYDVQVDFSNAGAGSYSTTLVVEYVLAP